MEPDPGTFTGLSSASPTCRTRAVHAAVGARRGDLEFIAGGAASSHVVSAGADGLPEGGPLVRVQVESLDDLTPDANVRQDGHRRFRAAGAAWRTWVAGARRDCIRRNALPSHERPVGVPLLIHERAPHLRLFLRHYGEDWAETVCYAIPPDRVRHA